MRQTIRWLCECGYKWIAPKIELIPKCPKCNGIKVSKIEDYYEKAPLQ